MSKEGFEPPTLWFVATCSSPLSYMPFFKKLFVFFIIALFWRKSTFPSFHWPFEWQEKRKKAEMKFGGAHTLELLWFSSFENSSSKQSQKRTKKKRRKGTKGTFLKEIPLLFWRKNPRKARKKSFYYADSFEAVFTYKIRRNDVGIIMNNAVAVNPKILTSISWK